MGRREDIEARMRQLEAERAQLDRYGEDNYDDGDVVKFVKTYRNRTRVLGPTSNRCITHDFTYVALKADGKWWLTGRYHDSEVGNGCTWDHLVEFMYAGIPVAYIMIAMESDFISKESYADRIRELDELAATSSAEDQVDYTVMSREEFRKLTEPDEPEVDTPVFDILDPNRG